MMTISGVGGAQRFVSRERSLPRSRGGQALAEDIAKLSMHEVDDASDPSLIRPRTCSQERLISRLELLTSIARTVVVGILHANDHQCCHAMPGPAPRTGDCRDGREFIADGSCSRTGHGPRERWTLLGDNGSWLEAGRSAVSSTPASDLILKFS